MYNGIQLADAFRERDVAAVERMLDAPDGEFKAALNQPIPGGDFGLTPLMGAVGAGSREIVDLLLDAGADINLRTNWWAGGFGVLDTAPLDLAPHLIARGARVDAHAASRLGMLDRLRELIDANPALVNARGGDGMLPLHFAATVEIARYLVEACGAGLDARDIDHESTAAQYMIRDRQTIVPYLISRGCRTDILMAAAVGDAALVERYLNANPESIHTTVSPRYFPMTNPGAGGSIYIWTLGTHKTAHLIAHEFGHAQIFDSLMARSPAPLRLAMACELGDETAARAILESGAVTLTESDQARLVNAAKNNEAAKVRLLLDCGWKPDAWDGGITALHWAAFHGNPTAAEALISRGAPIEVADRNHGSTVLGWAAYGSIHSWKRQDGDYPAVVDLLLAHGAKVPKKMNYATDAVRIRLGLSPSP